MGDLCRLNNWRLFELASGLRVMKERKVIPVDQMWPLIAHYCFLANSQDEQILHSRVVHQIILTALQQLESR